MLAIWVKGNDVCGFFACAVNSVCVLPFNDDFDENATRATDTARATSVSNSTNCLLVLPSVR